MAKEFTISISDELWSASVTNLQHIATDQGEAELTEEIMRGFLEGVSKQRLNSLVKTQLVKKADSDYVDL